MGAVVAIVPPWPLVQLDGRNPAACRIEALIAFARDPPYLSEEIARTSGSVHAVRVAVDRPAVRCTDRLSIPVYAL